MGNLVFQATLGGQVNLVGPNTASTFNLNVPAVSSTLSTTSGTETLTNKTLTTPVINGFTGDTSVVNIGSNQFYKDTAGNIGVGVVPRAKLDVNGGIILANSQNLSWGNVYGANIPLIAASSTVGIDFYANGSTSGLQMRLDAAGNLGVGVTPSTWATAKVVQVGSYGNISSLNNSTYIGQNFYYNAGFLYQNATSRYACLYEQNQFNGVHAWYNSAAGTAPNPITFTQAMTLDASGNLGVGTTSPSSLLHLSKTLSGSLTSAIQIQNYGTFTWGIGIDNAVSSSSLVFQTGGAGGTTRMALDSSGNLLVGTTSTSGLLLVGMLFYLVLEKVIHLLDTKQEQVQALLMLHICITELILVLLHKTVQQAFFYNLTSDYRLKNNPEALTGAKDFVMALQPKKWQWWDGSGEGVGFIAHEFMEVAKYSGNGEKDAVDINGNPIMQSIQPSSSEVMANLVAHIQNLETRLAALEQA